MLPWQHDRVMAPPPCPAAPAAPAADRDAERAAPQVLHADAWLLAVHKPAGLLVHRSRLDAHEDDDLLSRLQATRGERLWPAHRLDKGTSGALLLARDAATAGLLGVAFADGRVHKTYQALVRGWPAEAGETRTPLARDPERPSAGQPLLEACTRWQLLQRLSWPICTRPGIDTTRAALLQLQPLTGRRHQIRRHCKQLGHPLIGDATHGKGPLNRAVAAHLGLQRLWLHALRLELAHPATGAPLCIEAPPGPEWLRPAAAQGGPLPPG